MDIPQINLNEGTGEVMRFFFFQAEDGIRDLIVTGVQTCALPILALGANPGSGTLSGTTTVAAVAGVATLPGLSINKVGTGYTLTASATGATGTTSAAFTIAPGAASQLVFSVQPSDTTAGAASTAAGQLAAQDAPRH